MKTILSLILFNCLFGDTLHQTPVTNRQHSQTNELLFMSTIINNVLHHHWDDEELPCLQKTLDIMRNVQNHSVWATWVWDSMQSPTGVFFGSRNQLGNYEQCIYPPWVKTHPELLTQYCIADIEYTEKRVKLNDDPDLYLYSTKKNNSAINKLAWGLCLPAVCKPDSIKKFAKTFLNNTHLSFALSEATISIDSCQTYNDNTELSFGYYLTVGFIGSIILLTLYSTNYYENHRYRKKENRAIQLAKAFSIIQNTAELFKEKDDEIYTLNSLKFLTSCVLIYAHSIMICVNMGLKQSKSFNDFLETNALYVFLHLDILVDTFIMISGLLLIRGFLRSNKPVTINVVIKRYIRLTYVPMVLILFTTQVSKHYGEGPLQPRITFSEVESCRNYWWTNLLTINNFVHYSNACFPVTWSIACDFHLTILGTGLYWLYQKNRSLGLKAFFIGLVASIVLPTLVALREQLSPIQFKDLEALGDVRKHANFPTYLHSHLRSGPYFIGMAFGFLLCTYKPADYKKRLVNSSIVIFAFGFGLAVFIFMFGGYLAHHKYGVISDALYIGTNRSIWAIAMGLIIVSCEYGDIPLISDFLRWPIFVPLSKLSFGIYIIHWLVLIVKTSNTMSPDKIYLTYMIIDSLGMVTFCCGLSYLLWLVFESPMNNLVAIMLRKSSYKEVEEDENGNEAPNSVKKITNQHDAPGSTRSSNIIVMCCLP